ncbi:MAG TPA: cyclopropane-fatty-acyl-phospholipid synthase family protein [Acidimicrobiales bacterium]|nr:cyclopropane-fatty-acyl-phospholipid synthase family protein [Acidimicrobiales bacterium]
MTARRYELLDRALSLGVVPDAALRLGSRLSAWNRERNEARGGVEAQERRSADIVAHMSTGPVAELPAKANEQHYELPADFMALFMGARRKYSCCYWPAGVDTLDAAEDAMLRLTCERARIADGMQVLDLGCGWGALSLWMAEHYDVCIVAVSNSQSQRAWIEAERDRRGLTEKLEVITADVNAFEPEGSFDRVVSVEMFEHMRNWKELLHRISTWLKPDGLLFVHVFSHRSLAYRFADTWASERFFTAGTMPSHDLLLRFGEDFAVRERWALDGSHYAKTLAAWLERFDARRDEALAVLRRDRSESEARRLVATWRLFFISTKEIWSWRRGNAWMVSHYLLDPSPAQR